MSVSECMDICINLSTFSHRFFHFILKGTLLAHTYHALKFTNKLLIERARKLCMLSQSGGRVQLSLSPSISPLSLFQPQGSQYSVTRKVHVCLPKCRTWHVVRLTFDYTPHMATTTNYYYYTLY